MSFSTLPRQVNQWTLHIYSQDGDWAFHGSLLHLVSIEIGHKESVRSVATSNHAMPKEVEDCCLRSRQGHLAVAINCTPSAGMIITRTVEADRIRIWLEDRGYGDGGE